MITVQLTNGASCQQRRWLSTPPSVNALLPSTPLPRQRQQLLHGRTHYKVSFSRQRLLVPHAASSGLGVASAAATTDYFATDKRPIILFDGVCNLCNGGVNFMLDWDKQGVCRFAALQSPAGRALLQRSGRQPDDISSIVLVEEQQSYIKSEAILRIGLRLSLPLPLLAGLAQLVPLPLRDGVYEQVADNRYSFFGRSSSCRLSAEGFQDRFIEA